MQEGIILIGSDISRFSRGTHGDENYVAIVKPETVVAWHRAGFRLFWTWKVRHGQPGRPLISREVRDLIRKMCQENPAWGAPRIHGELLKLGIDIGESSVSKYMVRSRKPPSQTWRTFLENHAKQLVSIDFFTVPSIRFQVLYVFLVLAHDRRRILLQCDRPPDRGVDGTATARGISLCPTPALPAARPRCYLRGCLPRTGARHGHLRSSVCTALTLAKSLRGASDWIDSTRVPRSCDRVPRSLVTANPQFVFRLLSPIENTSFLEEGLTGTTSHSASGNGVRGGATAGRWTASPLRTTGCLKSPNPPRHVLSHLGPLKFVFELCSLADACIGEVRSPDSGRATNCWTSAVRLGNDIPHGPRRIFGSVVFERHDRGKPESALPHLSTAPRASVPQERIAPLPHPHSGGTASGSGLHRARPARQRKLALSPLEEPGQVLGEAWNLAGVRS